MKINIQETIDTERRAACSGEVKMSVERRIPCAPWRRNAEPQAPLAGRWIEDGGGERIPRNDRRWLKRKAERKGRWNGRWRSGWKRWKKQ